MPGRYSGLDLYCGVPSTPHSLPPLCGPEVFLITKEGNLTNGPHGLSVTGESRGGSIRLLWFCTCAGPSTLWWSWGKPEHPSRCPSSGVVYNLHVLQCWHFSNSHCWIQNSWRGGYCNLSTSTLAGSGSSWEMFLVEMEHFLLLFPKILLGDNFLRFIPQCSLSFFHWVMKKMSAISFFLQGWISSLLQSLWTTQLLFKSYPVDLRKHNSFHLAAKFLGEQKWEFWNTREKITKRALHFY